MPKEERKIFFWKGKRVTEKVYNARLKQQESGRNIHSIYGTKNSKHNLAATTDTTESQSNLNVRSDRSKFINLEDEGYKIINVMEFGRQLICKKCSSILSLLDTKSSVASDLGTTYHVECRKCLFTNEATTVN